ncbi:MAG: cytochrome c oxidase assembly protein [Dehalococcoidia bacterium]
MLSPDLLRATTEGVVTAHGSIPPGMPWWQAWSFDPALIVPVAIVGWFYLRGLRRWEHRSREHPWWRTALFATGLGIYVLSMESPVDRLGAHHFSMHMVQHELVMTYAVPLMLLGAPTTPLLRGMPGWMRQGIVRPLAGRAATRWAYRALTHPAVTIFLMTVVVWSWHLVPGWWEASLADQKVHDVQHVSFTLVSLLFWWNVIDPKPLHSRIAHLPRVLYIFAGTIPKHVLAAMLTFAPHTFYPTYETVRRVLPIDPASDQQLAGVIMWVPSEAITLIAMAIVFFTWLRIGERRQRRADAERYGSPAL